jgi:hypothetical protein
LIVSSFIALYELPNIRRANGIYSLNICTYSINHRIAKSKRLAGVVIFRVILSMAPIELLMMKN